MLADTVGVLRGRCVVGTKRLPSCGLFAVYLDRTHKYETPSTGCRRTPGEALGRLNVNPTEFGQRICSTLTHDVNARGQMHDRIAAIERCRHWTICSNPINAGARTCRRVSARHRSYPIIPRDALGQKRLPDKTGRTSNQKRRALPL